MQKRIIQAMYYYLTSKRSGSKIIAIGIMALSISGCGIKITSPPDNSEYVQGVQIELKARRLLGASSVHDFEWSSSIDGNLGTGDDLIIPDLSVGRGPLSEGHHVIQAEHSGLFIWHSWRDDVSLTVTSCKTPDTKGLPVLTYNEGLATVLRGVEIKAGAVSNLLGVPPGYYRIREFRVWGLPEEKVKTLNIKKAYGEMAVGSSTLPKRDEEWVFSVIEENEWTPEHRNFKAYDFHGHTFEYEITLDSANNCWNTKASIDCVEVPMSTQTYTTGTLNTCNWDSESPWTTP